MLNVSISGSEKDLSLVYSYDCKTDTWTLVAPISSPRDAVGVCVLGDRLYAVGGYDGQQYLNDVESYDAQNNEWTKVSVFTAPQQLHPLHHGLVPPLASCGSSGVS